ncbi:MAG TPA: hypothetical protein VGA00_13185 [Acidiferrobacterales bacterium]
MTDLVHRLLGGMAVALAATGCAESVSVGPETGAGVPCLSYYAMCVDRVFHVPRSNPGSCSGQGDGCHARVDDAAGRTIAQGIGGRFKVNAILFTSGSTGDAALDELIMTKNYETAVGMANLFNVPSSLLLTKPLQEPAGVSHLGGALFADTSDADYQTIRTWLGNTDSVRGNLAPAQDTGLCQALLATNPC